MSRYILPGKGETVEITTIGQDGKITHYLPSSKIPDLVQWLRENGAVELQRGKGL